MNLDEKKNFIVNTTYFTVCGIIIYLVFRFAAEYLFPFLIGVIVAYSVQKPAKQLSVKSGIKTENLAAIFSVFFFITIIGIIALFVWFLGVQIAEVVSYFSKNTDRISFFLDNISNTINNVVVKENSPFKEAIKNLTDGMIKGVTVRLGNFLSNIFTNIIKKIPNFFISSIITIVATFYISKDFERLKKFSKGIISEKSMNVVIEIKNILTNCFLKFVVGYLWIFLITFTELFFGFMILGVEKFLVVALMVAFLDLLPVIGTGTVLLPWSIFSFIANNFSRGIGLVLLYIVIVVVRNFSEPRIIGKQIEINPLFMLVFIFVGLKLGGILGMLLLPVILTVLFTYFKQKYADLK